MPTLRYLLLSALAATTLSAPTFVHPCKDSPNAAHALRLPHHGSQEQILQAVLKTLLPHRVHVSATANPKQLVDDDIILELHPTDEQRLSDADKQHVRHVMFEHYRSQQDVVGNGRGLHAYQEELYLREVQGKAQLISAQVVEEEGQMEGSARFEAMEEEGKTGKEEMQGGMGARKEKAGLVLGDGVAEDMEGATELKKRTEEGSFWEWKM